MPSEDTEFRDAVQEVIKRQDPSADDLRSLAATLEHIADKWDAMDDSL